MSIHVEEVLEFVEENDIKFIRLTFCDLFGVQKNTAILSSQLERALRRGMPFDASAVPGFAGLEEGDLLLFPEPGTLALMPWRPAQGRVARFCCALRRGDGSPAPGDGREFLRRAAAQAAELGYAARLGTQCEFYLFSTDGEGRPTLEPQDRAGYLDVAPADRGENVRREICLTLEEMGVTPESSHHERGPGQNEIDFQAAAPLRAVDNYLSLRTVVKAVASRNGLYASFLPKPLQDQSGSGLHLDLSLFREGENLFDGFLGSPHPDAGAFLAGVMRRLPEMTIFLNPLPGSYRRLGSLGSSLAVAWSGRNRSRLLRVPSAPGEPGRMEVRSPDPACNPYFAVGLLLLAGLEGVRDGLAAPAQEEGAGRLPAAMDLALELARQSGFLRRSLPEGVLDAFLDEKGRQWEEYRHARNQHQWELDRFFEMI